MRIFVCAVVLLLAGVLTVSLAGKVRSAEKFAAFAAGVEGLGLGRGRSSRLVAAAAVGAEAAVLAALLWPAGVVAGLGSAAALFAAFTVTLAVAVRRGAQVGCHCFGASSTPVARRHVVRSGLLCAVAVVALGCAVTGQALPLTGLAAPHVLIAVVTAAIGVAVVVWLDDLVWLFHRAPTTSRRSR